MKGSTQKTNQTDRPVVLLVEDKPRFLKTRQRLFHEHGFMSIGVTTAEDALREFRTTPSVDLVVTDVNLDERDSTDTSGVDVALALNELRPELPIVGLSGVIDELKPQAKQAFRQSVTKGRTLQASDLEDGIDAWKTEALAYRALRERHLQTALDDLDHRGAPGDVTVEILREFLPGAHAGYATAVNRDAEIEAPDSLLREAGWRLQLIQAGEIIRTPDHRKAKTKLAIPIWIHETEMRVIVVLHGFSCLRHEAETVDDALQGLLKLMLGCRDESTRNVLSLAPSESGELVDFLTATFEQRIARNVGS